MEKYYIEALSIIKLNCDVNPKSIAITGLGSDASWAVLVEMNKEGLISLTKSRVWLRGKGEVYLLDRSDDISPETLKISTDTHTQSILKRISNIKLSDWGWIFTILGILITIWFSIIKPIIDNALK